MSLPNYPEIRSELRYRLRLPVLVRAVDGSGEEIIALSENISAHGILLRTEMPISEGTRLRLPILVGYRHPQKRHVFWPKEERCAPNDAEAGAL